MNTEPENEDFTPLRVRWYHPEFIFAFLNFHRRSILGAMLVAGLAYLLVSLKDQRSPSEDYDVSTYTPTNSDSQTGLTPSSSLTEGSLTTQKTAPIDPAAPKTTNERINELLNTASDWSSLNSDVAVEFLEKRLVTLRDLLQAQDLKPRQRQYCELHFIDSVTLLSKLAQSTNGEADRFDYLLIEVERKYGDSEDSEVAAAANIATVSYLASQFAATSSDENFEAFSTAWRDGHDAIMESKRTAEQMTLIFIETIKLTGDDPRLQQIAAEHMSEVVDIQKTAATDLATALFFRGAGLDTLPKRILNKAPEAENDMQLFARQLEQHPNVPLPVYSIFASSIARYMDIGESEKAEQYMEHLQAIATTIQTQRIREEVVKGIEELKELGNDDTDS